MIVFEGSNTTVVPPKKGDHRLLKTKTYVDKCFSTKETTDYQLQRFNGEDWVNIATEYEYKYH